MQELPRIPYLNHFEKIVEIGQKLLDLHVNYEDVPANQNVKIEYFNVDPNQLSKQHYEIRKMALSKDRQTLKFNDYITIKNIPLKMHDYQVGGRPVLNWIIRQYQYSIDPESNIINDPNKFDQVKGGKYVFDLILSLITLSLETLDLIDQLPEYQEI